MARSTLVRGLFLFTLTVIFVSNVYLPLASAVKAASKRPLRLASSATKTASKHPFYLRANLIYSVPARDFLRGAKFKQTPGVLLSIGRRFNTVFRADISADYRGMYKYSNAKYGRAKIKSMTYLVSGYLSHKARRIEPFVTAGIGVASNKVSDIIITTKGNAQIGKRCSSFAWTIGTGLNYKINRSIQLNLAYRYLNFGKIRTTNRIIAYNGAQLLKEVRYGKGASHDILFGMLFNLTT